MLSVTYKDYYVMKDLAFSLLENELFLEVSLNLDKGEELIFQTQATHTPGGTTRFSKQLGVGGMGVLYVTNKKLSFLSNRSYVGGQDVNISIDSINEIKKEKMNLPMKIATLGIAPIMAKLLGQGYLSIKHGKYNVETNFSVMNPNKVISLVMQLKKTR